MNAAQPIARIEVGQRARDAQHAVIAPRRQMQPLRY